MPMDVRFPFELFQLIIDELRFAFSDLKVCSLVCKAWLPRCRAHLYRVLHIGPRRICGIQKEQMPHLFEKFQDSFTTTFQNPAVLSCIKGLCLDSHIRDVIFKPPHLVLPSQILGRAVIKPSISSIELPFHQLRSLRTHWRLFSDTLKNKIEDDSDDLAIFEQVLDRIDHLEHLGIEKYWHFHAYRDILRSIAVHAPHLKTLCLSEFRWYPSFNIDVLEDIFDEWDSKFASSGCPPLRLERLCLRNFSTKGTDVIHKVVLPSSCLDLSSLRYLAMPAGDIQKAFSDERFSKLWKELVHLTITDLDTSELQLRTQSYPMLSQLQLFAKDDWHLLQFLANSASNWVSGLSELDLHINFETVYADLVEETTSPSKLDAFHDILTSSVDPLLQALIHKMLWRGDKARNGHIYISMDFIQANGGERQRECIRKAFPLSYETGHLHWRDRRVLEWWFE